MASALEVERYEQDSNDGDGDSSIDLPLPDRIRQQVEFYLSDGNLARDKFLLKHLIADASGEGFLPLSLLGSFPRMKKLTKDVNEVRAALKNSETLIVSSNGDSVKRKSPFFPGDEDLLTKKDDPILRKLYVSNLPKDSTKDALIEVFSIYGRVRKLDIPKTPTGEIKGVAFVEYYTKDDAQNALDRFPKIEGGIIVGPFSDNSAKRERERREGVLSGEDIDPLRARRGLSPTQDPTPHPRNQRRSTEVKAEKRLSVEVEPKNRAQRQSASKADLEKNTERRERLSTGTFQAQGDDQRQKRLSSEPAGSKNWRLSSGKDYDFGDRSKRLSANKADLEQGSGEGREKRLSREVGRRKTSTPPAPDWDPENPGQRPQLTFLHKDRVEHPPSLISPIRQPHGPPSNGEKGFGRGRGKPL